MMGDPVTLHAFVSSKGGVGKSALAVATANILASEGRRPIVLDLDLTGSSLADGLLLRAPVVETDAGGELVLTAPPTGATHSVEETRRLRNLRERAGARQALPPPYLNDVLAYRSDDPSTDCRFEALLWLSEPDHGVRFLPSSALEADITEALDWLFAGGSGIPSRWIRRVAWVLWGLRQCAWRPTDLILDLPPGLFGFARAVLELMAALAAGDRLRDGFPDFGEAGDRWAVHPVLVTTEDRNSLRLSLEAYLRLKQQLPALELVLNRGTEGAESRARWIEAQFGRMGLENHIAVVGEMRTGLGGLFVRRSLGQLTDEERRSLRTAVLGGGTR